MLASLLMILGLSLLVVCVVAMFMWMDVATRGDRIEAERRKAARNWRPPFVRGGVLLNWAAETAKRVVSEGLSGKRSGTTPVKLAAQLQQGATRAMLPLVPERDVGRAVPCPDKGQGMIGVTAPEVLEIADDIRRTISRAERNRIHDLALQNSKKIADLGHTQFNAAETACPLLGSDHLCCVYATRPLRCRPLHTAAIAKSFGLEAGGQDPSEASFEQTVQQGVELGLMCGLKSAGLDANLYELNSALVTALDTPDAASRWVEGEDVFAGCKLYR